MQKIKDLHSFILSLNLFEAGQLDSDVDDLVITPKCYAHSVPGQMVITEKDYTATFYIERYPHHLQSEDLLIAQISAWLIENDESRTEPRQYQMIVEPLDSQTVNLEFGIPFNELVIAVEDSNGNISIKGTQYSLL